ncbi:carbohydrate kinase family protein [Agromyces marinus]|uniref:Carbohydrate kinase PfkB domain-containing protein n=1 Tax=Agromyces marinus TaxID=1389020 RepID=A0ABN6YBT1_9MICO|nr:PfkB family carbohydrate kinase [Agromyces marinus]UIP57251.1 Ribokinase [Agromyces marinus]BDZ54658.1 hypothetical protein GCM10025870_17310 [Agromyces marinus]
MTRPHVPRVAVVGDALIDELRDPRGTREFVGGAALNVATGLALLGTDATLVAMIGDDEPGRRIRSFLIDYDVALVASPSELGSSRAVSIRTSGGEPRYEFNAAARARRLAFDGTTRDALDAADLVVVSCYPFDDDEQVEALLGAVRDPRRRLVIDANPRAGMLHDRDRFLANLLRAAATSVLVKVGDDDADLLAGTSLEQFVRVLGQRGCPAVLATAGRHGASVHTAALEVHSGVVELPGPIVDTMGAGDATLAGVVHRIAAGGMPATAETWASVLAEAMGIAAATIRQEGALLRTPREPGHPGS